MKLKELVALHGAAIGAMNDAHSAIERIEDALRVAKAAYESACKTEALLSAAVTATDRAERGVK
jgi:hypothetical protein